MKNIICILFLVAYNLSAQVPILTFNQTDADSLEGRYGRYSALDPVPLPDGTYALPQRCLYAPDLTLDSLDDTIVVTYQIKDLLLDFAQDTNQITDMPEIGQEVVMDRIYKYHDETGNIDENQSGLVKCVQTHNRTIYPPYETPALFSFFRENSDTLTWIENEYVYLGWKRVYEGTTYEVIQEHMTLITWTPDATPALWQAVAGECEDWAQPTGAQDAYDLDACVIHNGFTWISGYDANVWEPGIFGWTQQ